MTNNGFPLVHWHNLIFPHLELDDLVSLQRTCKEFAQYERLKHGIKQKISEAFLFFTPVHWNRSARMAVEPGEIHKWITRHPHLLAYVRYEAGKFQVAMFSSKRRLIQFFIDWHTNLGNDIRFTQFPSPQSVKFSLKSAIYYELPQVLFVGIGEEIIEWMK